MDEISKDGSKLDHKDSPKLDYKDSSRLDYVDYVKAICIVLVIMVHTGLDAVQYISIFIIPSFFALSGFLYISGKRTKKQFIRERFRRLIIPFWLLVVMYAPVEAVRSAVFGYGSPKNLLTFPVYMLYGSSILAPATGLTEAMSAFMYPYQMAFGRVYIASPSANHLWFLPALFIGSILFCILEEKTRNGILQKAAAIAVLLGIAYLDSAVKTVTQLPWAIGTGAFCAACMLCGYWARQYHFTEKGPLFTGVTAIIGVLFAILAEYLGSTGGAFISSYYGPYGIWSICLTFAGGLGGSWAVLYIMKKLDELPSVLTSVKRMLSLAGKASMQIYLYHMVFVFILGYAFLMITGIEPQLDGWLLGFIPITPATTIFLIAESLVITILITWLSHRRKK